MTNSRQIIEETGVEVFSGKLNVDRVTLFGANNTLFIISTDKLFSPDIIHAVALKPVIYTAFVSSWLGRKPRVSALGGLGFVFASKKIKAKLLRPMVVRILRYVTRKNHLLILRNHDDLDVLQKHNIVNEKDVRIIRGSGVDVNTFVPTVSIANEIPIVLLPTRMLWDKGGGCSGRTSVKIIWNLGSLCSCGWSR